MTGLAAAGGIALATITGVTFARAASASSTTADQGTNQDSGCDNSGTITGNGDDGSGQSTDQNAPQLQPPQQAPRWSFGGGSHASSGGS